MRNNGKYENVWSKNHKEQRIALTDAFVRSLFKAKADRLTAVPLFDHQMSPRIGVSSAALLIKLEEEPIECAGS